ncbi:MAG: response regulator transcription factor [Bdellovibrionales bacterium]|nr:response regulator transcription factor [Bdellovibrionales bacterium]
MPNQNQVLIIEDEMDIGSLLKMQVKQMGYEVEHVTSGEEALARLNKNAYDLILLDWMLPGLSGVEIAQLVRKMDTMKDVAIFMLTAKADADSIVEGLDAGADDYVTKPFSNEVLRARIGSLLRRVTREADVEESHEAQQPLLDDIEMGPLKVSLKTYKAFLDGEEMSLTPSEFKLLTTMLQHRGRVLTRARLIEEVQGEGISVIGRTVDTHVFGLRKKLGPHSDLIETVRGVGYRIRDDLY